MSETWNFISEIKMQSTCPNLLSVNLKLFSVKRDTLGRSLLKLILSMEAASARRNTEIGLCHQGAEIYEKRHIN